MPHKAFTVDEARALIPTLEGVLSRMDGLRLEAQRCHDRLQVLDLLWDGRLEEPGNPDREEAEQRRTELLRCAREIERLIEEEIVGRGIRFPQGGLEHGLVDFPTTWQGRWVYLCWRRGEPALTAWHEVDAGYAGRRALTEEQVRRMGREDDPADVDDSPLDF